MSRSTTDDNPTYQLFEAIRVLTQTHEVIIDDKHGTFLGSRTELPLLLKLRTAQASNIGGAGGAGKAGRERVPLNVGAADLYDRIQGDIREWFGRETDYAEHGRPLPEVVLQQWYLRYVNRWRAQEITDASVWERERDVQNWITQIRDLLDPPFRFPLTAPCPICGKEWVTLNNEDDENEREQVRVLNAVERERIEDSYVVCRNPECGRIWRGVHEARQLRIAIDDADLERWKETSA